MTSQEYRAKRKEVLERFGDFDEMHELANTDTYFNKVVSCLVYEKINEYELMLMLLNVIRDQTKTVQDIYAKYAYPQIIKTNGDT